MVSITQTLAHIKSQEIIEHIKQLYDNKISHMSPMALKIFENAVINVGWTLTFYLTTCYLVDYNL